MNKAFLKSKSINKYTYTKSPLYVKFTKTLITNTQNETINSNAISISNIHKKHKKPMSCNALKSILSNHSPSVSLSNVDSNPKEQFSKVVIKGKLLKAMNSTLILPKEKVIFLNNKYHYETENRENEKEKIHQNNYRKNKNLNITTQRTPNLIQSETNSNRYEDIYLTPKEFLNKNFDIEEQKIMFKDPKFFALTKEPFRSAKIKMNSHLKDILNQEEKDYIRKKLKNSALHIKPKKLFSSKPPIIKHKKLQSTRITPKLSASSTITNIFNKTKLRTGYNSSKNLFTTSNTKQRTLHSINERMIQFSERREEFLEDRNYQYYKKELRKKENRDTKFKRIEKENQELLKGQEIAKIIKKIYTTHH